MVVNPPGRMSDVALCVSVSAAAKITNLRQLATVPREVMVVVPVMRTTGVAAAPMLHVAAERTSVVAWIVPIDRALNAVAKSLCVESAAVGSMISPAVASEKVLAGSV